jgi:DNA topoisomerase I
LKLIISEKAIAGQRISAILAGKTVPMENFNGAKAFRFKKNSEEFMLIPLRGHIVDVDFPKKYSYWLGTDLKQLTYAEIEYVEKEKLISNALKKISSSVDEIIVATDMDREGEAIGRESVNFVLSSNPSIKVSRASFSAIIKKEIEESFANLGKLDIPLADSADARREIDLIWGAVLTRFLSLITGRLGKDFLSVGRVQTPTLAIIVGREKERRAFIEKDYWELGALLSKDGKEFNAEHENGKFFDEKTAQSAKSGSNSDEAIVSSIVRKSKMLKRPEPFNTTSFLRASTSIGLTASDAMSQAESLYQKGFTSYPRTDNSAYPPNLDLKKILEEVSRVPEFSSDAKKILSSGKIVPSKGKETKDHPPIYPVSAAKKNDLSVKEWKVYELICRRFLATLCEDAKTDNVTVNLKIGNEPFIAHGQVFLEKGWKKVYPYSALNEVILPDMKEGDIAKVLKKIFEKKKTLPPNRYSQSTLIKLMEQNGLGTKSTRHVIIQKLFARNYISGLKSIEPNEIAFGVVDVLERFDVDAVKAEMSATLEKEMDLVSCGDSDKEKVVKNSREMLSAVLEKLVKNKNEIGTELRKAFFSDSVFGLCDKCKEGSLRKIKSRNNKWFLGCTSYPKCTNTYPLPQTGVVVAGKDLCEICKKFTISVTGKRYKYKMCVDPNCPSKDEWKKKTFNNPKK